MQSRNVSPEPLRPATIGTTYKYDLLEIGTEAGLLVDRATSVAVAEWSYGHAACTDCDAGS